MISVVVVTYGNRWNLLSMVLEKLHSVSAVGKVILVDNASSYDVVGNCNSAGFEKVDVVRNRSNLGSAGGFSRGISLAMQDPENLILLLDDDNLPKDDSIEKLMATYWRLASANSEEGFAVAAYRDSQHGGFNKPVKPLFMLGRDFLGFNLFNAIQRHFGLVECHFEKKPGPDCAKFHRGNAYGGLLFSPKLIEKIGLPLDDLVLYFDDIEFTSRIIDNGGMIWLDTDSIVEDIEKNYSASLFKIPIFGFVLGESNKKIYYIIRNRSFIDKFIDGKSSFFYSINKHGFSIFVYIACLFTFKWDRLRAVYKAISDSGRGRMGVSSKYPL